MKPNPMQPPDVPAWQRWQAQGSHAQRVDYWKHVICQAVLDAEMSLPPRGEAGSFNGRIYSLNQAGARFINFRSSAHKVMRTSFQADRNDDAYFMVGLQRSGQGLMTQAGSACALNPGDVGIIDSGMPFELHFPDVVDRRVVLLPKHLLHRQLKNGLICKPPQRLDSNLVMSPPIRQIIHTLTEQDRPLNDAQTHFMLQSLADYLAQCLWSYDSGADKQSATRGKFDQVLSYIDQNLTSAELSAASAALSANLSLRTLHRLFKTFAECSFEQHVIEQRLSLARQRLLSGEAPSVSAAAFDAGFNDLSHFTKRFRATYGQKPSTLLPRRINCMQINQS